MSETVYSEQLWYTWSTTGLDAIPAGIRVRAASPGLMDVNSPRMRTLDRYLRYSLPTGTNMLDVNPQQAPICLTFTRGDQGERVLAHKVYTGRDGRNRPGNYFVHLLAGLPSTFSAKDAIALWRSPSWQTSDVPVHEQSTHLQEISPTTFRAPLAPWHTVDTLKMDQYVPRFIQAYLLHRDSLEKAQQRQDMQRDIAILKQEIQKRSKDRQKKDLAELQAALHTREQFLQNLPPRAFQHIYLAAAADEAAYLLSCLVNVLPQKWLADLTFSTYEQDIQVKHDCVIINTCPPPTASEAENSAQDILPRAYYEELALNCYRDHVSLPYDIPYAVEYATYAADVLETYNRDDDELETHNREELDNFLQEMESIDGLTVKDFLQAFNSTVLKKMYTHEEIETIYQHTKQAIRLMKKVEFRAAVRSAVIQDPQWFQITLKPLLADLYQQSKLISPIADSLARALNNFAQTLKEPIISCAVRDEQASFDALLLLTEYIAPPSEQPTFWTGSLLAITNHAAAKSILHNWNMRQPLLRIAIQILSLEVQEQRIIAETLLSCPESEFYRLLLLKLPPQWKLYAAILFDRHTHGVLDRDIVSILEQHTGNVTELFLQLLSNPSQEKRGIALSLFTKLANSGYQALDQLHDLWWKQGATSQELSELLHISRASLNTREELLQRYGNRYLKDDNTAPLIIEQFQRIISHNPANKLSLLFKLLDQSVSQSSLEQLLTSAQLSNDENSSFLKRYEPENWQHYPTYPSLYPTANIWLPMLTTFAMRRYNELKWQLLSNCLDALRQPYSPPFDQSIELLLQAAQLDTNEAWRFFENYSTYFVPFCYQSAIARSLYRPPSGQSASSSKKLHILQTWFARQRDLTQEDMEWLLLNSSLTTSEEAELVERYAQIYLTHYPTSQVLLSCVDRYLNTFNFASYYSNRIRCHELLAFLNNTPSLPDSILSHAQIIFKVVTLTQQEFFSQKDVKELGQALYEHPSEKRAQLLQLTAEALALCIKDAIQLGTILVTFMRIFNTSDTDRMFYIMVERVQALSRREGSKAGASISAYLQLIFYGDAVYTMQEAERKKLLAILLEPHTPAQVLKAINNVANTWPDALREKWRHELHTRFSITAGPDGQFVHQGSEAAHLQVIPSITTKKQTSQSKPVGLSQHIRNTSRLLLDIPLALFVVFWLLPRACKSGTGQLTVLWSQHHALLARHMHLIHEQSWREMQFAVTFHKLCMTADDANSIEAERQILRLVNDEQNKPYLPKWTEHEIVRIKLAHERTQPQQPAKQPYAQPSSISPKMGLPPISDLSTVPRPQPPVRNHYQ